MNVKDELETIIWENNPLPYRYKNPQWNNWRKQLWAKRTKKLAQAIIDKIPQWVRVDEEGEVRVK